MNKTNNLKISNKLILMIQTQLKVKKFNPNIIKIKLANKKMKMKKSIISKIIIINQILFQIHKKILNFNKKLMII